MAEIKDADRNPRTAPAPIDPMAYYFKDILLLDNPGAVRLYLIRHAHAVAADEEAERPLSKKGREQVRRLANFLKHSDVFRPDEIWHSPLVRSRQTAELLARHLDLAPPLLRVVDLKPADAPRTAARRIGKIEKSLAIVGHEPHLSALASLLVAGATEPTLFVLKKCAALALERGDRGWQVRWLISPEAIA